MAQVLSYHVRNWDQYYGTGAGVECACNDCHTKKTQKHRIVVELCIPGCCEGCNNNLADAVTVMDGFERLEFDGKKLTVIGVLRAEEVLKVCKKVKKSVKFWPQETESTLAKAKSGKSRHQVALHDSEPCSIL